MLQIFVSMIFFFGMVLALRLTQTMSQWHPTKEQQYGTPKLHHVAIINSGIFFNST
jgi:hypothetical protein